MKGTSALLRTLLARRMRVCVRTVWSQPSHCWRRFGWVWLLVGWWVLASPMALANSVSQSFNQAEQSRWLAQVQATLDNQRDELRRPDTERHNAAIIAGLHNLRYSEEARRHGRLQTQQDRLVSQGEDFAAQTEALRAELEPVEQELQQQITAFSLELRRACCPRQNLRRMSALMNGGIETFRAQQRKFVDQDAKLSSLKRKQQHVETSIERGAHRLNAAIHQSDIVERDLYHHRVGQTAAISRQAARQRFLEKREALARFRDRVLAMSLHQDTYQATDVDGRKYVAEAVNITATNPPRGGHVISKLPLVANNKAGESNTAFVQVKHAIENGRLAPQSPAELRLAATAMRHMNIQAVISLPSTYQLPKASVYNSMDLPHQALLARVKPDDPFLAVWSTMPIAGDIVRGPAEITGAESQAEAGFRIISDSAQAVVAPGGGRVLFAGEFKNFGQLLIIDHGRDYHTLLSGLTVVRVSVGDQIVAGQVVGSISEGRTIGESLYVELRRSGVPVNPVSWFAQRQVKKVQG